MRQQLGDRADVGLGEGIDVGQVDDDDVAKVVATVAPHLSDTEALEERRHVVDGRLRDPGHRRVIVGRRAEARLTVSPASALSRLDLPTPVPPTRART